ncbi:NUDIX hydrolase [Rhizobium oryziradicis]|nr:NUDIX domain-containing protein [Rhizobium oryziradicis]
MPMKEIGSALRKESLPILTVDVVVLTLDNGQLQVLLHRRPNAPFAGAWALPGGFVRVGEDSDTLAAIQRVLRSKVGATNIYVEQLATYSGEMRDPRGWSLSVAYIALLPKSDLQIVDSPDVALLDTKSLPELAFDHALILKDALARLRGKGAYSTLPAMLLKKEFTLSELQLAYEVVLGEKLDTSAFRRKVGDFEFLEKTGSNSSELSKRPARLFRLKNDVQMFDRTLGRSG